MFKKIESHFLARFNVSILNLKLCKLNALRTKTQEKNRVYYSFQIEFKFVWKLLTGCVAKRTDTLDTEDNETRVTSSFYTNRLYRFNVTLFLCITEYSVFKTVLFRCIYWMFIVEKKKHF